ncbi:MAG TPA: alpha-hydroxy-acid oxidizing protein [Flexivirga sp.]|uniref:alpha-hydroxy-acid oxidizing protein n=1 Tax=Flexivirga sp. TaxID=1962927 RepID=UPI002BEF80E7|nr:alpha-hydroxy-acid oxidizing protein [Flexivirga sp.]HWC22135.1 alpha-hydroxy-acid oxidizing protein [Flexivirga sp.]
MEESRIETPARALSGIGRAVQGAIYAAGAYGHKPKVPVEPAALYAAARRRMSPQAWSYVAGSAGMQRTDAANIAAFERYPIVPRLLRDVGERSLGVSLCGHDLPAPVLFAPIGVLEMAHKEAELAVAEAARSLGLPMVLSTQGSVPMEQTAKALRANPMWYQLYWSNNDDLARSLVRRAEKSRAQAIVVTLDTPLLGWRTKDLDLGYLPFARGEGIAQYLTDPVFQNLVRDRVAEVPEEPARDERVSRRDLSSERPTLTAIRTLASITRHYPGRFRDNLRSPLPRAAVETFLDVFPCPGLSWDDLAKLRDWTSLPVILKGIQSVDDARLALEHGADGIIVSNHGGRQVDGAIASLDALAAIAPVVDGQVPVLFDSGIRSGADIFKALALGASAVLVGRPWLYGLALDGAAGAQAVMERLLAELDLTMGLSGIASIDQITRDCLST